MHNASPNHGLLGMNIQPTININIYLIIYIYIVPEAICLTYFVYEIVSTPLSIGEFFFTDIFLNKIDQQCQ